MKENYNVPVNHKGKGLQPQILLVDDELTLGKGLEKILKKEGYTVDYATTGQGALDFFGQKPYDLLVADLRLPDIDGLEVIKKAKGKNPDLQVIIITGYGTVPSAVGAMKMGVFDYLSKPFTKNEFVDSVQGALETIYAPMLKEAAQQRETAAIQERTAREKAFKHEVWDRAFEALGNDPIPYEAKNAVISGDFAWITDHLDRLSNDQFRALLTSVETEASLIQSREGSPVLEESPEESASWIDRRGLWEKGFEALGKSPIPNEVKNAVVSGDFGWITDHLDQLSDNQFRSLLTSVETEVSLIEKKEVAQILERTAEDRTFWVDLLERGSFALRDYRISNDAKAAILSGDLLWIKEHAGDLSEKQLRWIISRLEMESW